MTPFEPQTVGWDAPLQTGSSAPGQSGAALYPSGSVPQYGIGQDRIDAMTAANPSYGYTNADAGSGPMQPTGVGFGPTTQGSRVVSQQSTGGNGNIAALLQSLMQQAQTSQTARMTQYQQLIKQIMGSKGYLGGLGKTGTAQIAENRGKALGDLTQSLTSRGLGNTTIVDSMKGGVNRNFDMEQQSLNENVGQQKANMSAQLFNMNPSPSSSTYLDLLTRLGSAGGAAGSGGGGGQVLGQR